MLTSRFTYNLGKVALGHNIIFGLLVFSEDGWVPFSEGTPEQQEWVRRVARDSALYPTLLSCMKEELFPREGE